MIFAWCGQTNKKSHIARIGALFYLIWYMTMMMMMMFCCGGGHNIVDIWNASIIYYTAIKLPASSSRWCGWCGECHKRRVSMLFCSTYHLYSSIIILIIPPASSHTSHTTNPSPASSISYVPLAHHHIILPPPPPPSSFDFWQRYDGRYNESPHNAWDMLQPVWTWQLGEAFGCWKVWVSLHEMQIPILHGKKESRLLLFLQHMLLPYWWHNTSES